MKILSRCSLTKDEDKGHRRQRSIRMISLPDEDAGVVFWEDYCDFYDWPKTPNSANIRRYTEVFVNEKEKKINRRRGLTKDDKGYLSGHVLFVKPVLRLQAQLWKAQNVAATSVVVHMSPSLNKSSNGKIHADDTLQVSTSTENNNNKRSMSELDTDSEDSTEDSSSQDSSRSSVSSLAVTVSSLAMSAPSKSPRSSNRRLTSSLATTVSPFRQETILQFSGHAHGKTSGVSHSNDPSGSDNSTLDARDLIVAYPQFKAYENHFRYKNQLVRTIQEAMKQKVVQSPEEAIQILESKWGAMEPSTFCKSKEFKTITKVDWGITTKVEKYWLCGQY
ncbi:hypothetical protein EDD11_008925 [Mortierella claussenii]|nr:hypothetical protein EDD11_008925 [Mortierella claussenii]